VPSVVIGTDEFLQLFKLESRARGLPELHHAITTHPIGGLRPPVLLEKAHALAEATARAILATEAQVPVAGD
jgi:hypothetical protein